MCDIDNVRFLKKELKPTSSQKMTRIQWTLSMILGLYCCVNGTLGCTDQSGVVKDSVTCADAGSSNRLCYDTDIETACCTTCTAANSGNTGCEYGDFKDDCDPGLCSIISNPLSDCCVTCATTTVTPTTTTTATTTTTTATTTTATTAPPPTTVAPTTTTAPPTTTTAMTASTTSSDSANSNIANTSSSSLSGGAIAGIVVSCTLVGATAGGILLYAVWHIYKSPKVGDISNTVNNNEKYRKDGNETNTVHEKDTLVDVRSSQMNGHIGNHQDHG